MVHRHRPQSDTGRSLSLIINTWDNIPPDAWLAEHLPGLATYVATALEATYPPPTTDPHATPEEAPTDTTTP